MVEEYLQKAESCVAIMKQAFAEYFENGLGAGFDELVEKTHISESACDDLRRKIETAMYEKALIPESRGDILGLLETIDKVPNQAESVLYQVQTEFLSMPRACAEKMQQLININCEAFDDLLTAMRMLFTDVQKLPTLLGDVDKKESASDHLEREIIRGLFSDKDIAPDQKILLKELVVEIGNISDRCENTADRLTIITAKRMV